MDMESRHAFLMAVKYKFMSRSIKTGSFINVILSNEERELKVDEENDKFLTSVTRNISNNVTVDKPFVCLTCHKRFTQKYHLKTHQRIHTGEKPYKCKPCHKRFTQKSDMKRHERIHTGEKPYKCKICHKRFTEKCNFKTHQRVHIGKKV